jgi:hypothetical protein
MLCFSIISSVRLAEESTKISNLFILILPPEAIAFKKIARALTLRSLFRARLSLILE